MDAQRCGGNFPFRLYLLESVIQTYVFHSEISELFFIALCLYLLLLFSCVLKFIRWLLFWKKMDYSYTHLKHFITYEGPLSLHKLWLRSSGIRALVSSLHKLELLNLVLLNFLSWIILWGGALLYIMCTLWCVTVLLSSNHRMLIASPELW